MLGCIQQLYFMRPFNLENSIDMVMVIKLSGCLLLSGNSSKRVSRYPEQQNRSHQNH